MLAALVLSMLPGAPLIHAVPIATCGPMTPAGTICRMPGPPEIRTFLTVPDPTDKFNFIATRSVRVLVSPPTPGLGVWKADGFHAYPEDARLYAYSFTLSLTYTSESTGQVWQESVALANMPVVQP